MGRNVKQSLRAQIPFRDTTVEYQSCFELRKFKFGVKTGSEKVHITLEKKVPVEFKYLCTTPLQFVNLFISTRVNQKYFKHSTKKFKQKVFETTKQESLASQRKARQQERCVTRSEM